MSRVAMLFDDLDVVEPVSAIGKAKREPPQRQIPEASSSTNGDALLETVLRLEMLVLKLGEKLEQAEKKLDGLLSRDSDKEWYTTRDVANLLHREEYTVREWARLGRVNAMKLETGRGDKGEWRISHQELLRIQNEGLLPDSRSIRPRIRG